MPKVSHLNPGPRQPMLGGYSVSEMFDLLRRCDSLTEQELCDLGLPAADGRQVQIGRALKAA